MVMVVLPAGIVVTGVFITVMAPYNEHMEILQNNYKTEPSPFLLESKCFRLMSDIKGLFTPSESGSESTKRSKHK